MRKIDSNRAQDQHNAQPGIPPRKKNVETERKKNPHSGKRNPETRKNLHRVHAFEQSKTGGVSFGE